jgi:hypothetical protein
MKEYSGWDETVHFTVIRSKRQGDQKGGRDNSKEASIFQTINIISQQQ